jgi:uncharacterized protein YlxP (DUF503 family)
VSINVGICKIRLRLPENSSLKGKRSVIKSLIAQVNNKFNVSIAEVEDQDAWQIATLGVTCISNDSQHNNEVLSKVVNFVDSGRFDIELLDYTIEILPV